MKEHEKWLRHMWYRINDVLYEKNRTKVDVALKCGFDRKRLIGENNFRVDTLYKICKELDVSADYLLFGTVNEDSNINDKVL